MPEAFWQDCFNALPFAACIFDHDGRLLAANQCWRQDAALSPALEPQADFSTLLHKPARWREACATLRQQTAPAHCELTIELLQQQALRSYRANLSRIAHGFLLCLRDISAELLELASLHSAAMPYQQGRQAMLVTDAANRIIAVNPAYTAMTGYSAAEALGKNPSFASSGRHDADFYRLLWHSLQTQGHWQGEIWNKRRDGSEIVEWLTIDVIHDEQGAVWRHLAMFSDITGKKQASEEKWRQVNLDALTGLPNRRLLQDRLETELKKAQRNQSEVALLFIDLDHFKEVNDSLGHAAGDLLLQQVTQRIVQRVRASDTVARLGGDEFIVMLSDVNTHAQASHLAQALLHALRQPFILPLASGKQEARISASIGIACYPQDATAPAALLECADSAMYQAKRQGKDRFACAQTDGGALPPN
ncbi:diguanylate cyclase [Massilia sp. W12]|uniref:diguanylate cyclase domain-containing protein n=1 Tax=Massilia sp. W12 TaxID=3126507 RepID=UPI0030CE19F1